MVAGDVVVLSSDGVFDSFGDINEYLGYINNTNLVNMDMLCEAILSEAIKRNNGNIVDDMSVVAVRWLDFW